MTTITIRLPMPAKELSPNSRAHWAPKAREKSIRRESAAMLIRTQLPRRFTPWEAATVKLVVTPPCGRKRDKDNLLASEKATFDGAEDAGLIENDAGFTYLPIDILPADKKNAGVEITFTKTK